MAVYQYTFELVPNGTNPYYSDGLDVKKSWRHHALDADQVAEHIDAFIPRSRSFSDRMYIWGDDTADDLQLWFDQRRVESLAARVNCAEPCALFIQHLAMIAAALGLSAVTLDSQLVIPSPNVFQLASHARHSDAAKVGNVPGVKQAYVANRARAQAWRQAMQSLLME